MRIFVLENDPQIYKFLELLAESGHEIHHAKNLQNAAILLEFDPKIDYFDLLFFDVELPAEKVVHPDGMNTFIYTEEKNLNGLMYILNRIDTLESLLTNVVVITAHKQRIIDMSSIDVFGREFKRMPLTEKQEKRRFERDQVLKINYEAEDNGKVYTLSFLDKGGDEIDTLIERFINRG